MIDLLELSLNVATPDPMDESVRVAQALIDEVVSGGAVVELTGFGPCGETTHTKVWLRGYLSDTPAHARELHALRQRLLQLPYSDRYGELQICRLGQQDWAEAWKKHYHALRVGQHMMIVPAWEQPELKADDVAIWIEPGMAFGTGTHPSTQLALQLLERLLQPGQEVLDVGTGSGILSIAALKLGASHVLATDIDADAVAAAMDNARRNNVHTDLTTLVGSLPPPRHYPLVCVNILADVIADLLLHEDLSAYVADDGVLILSGIIEQRRHVVDLALAARHMHVIDTIYEGEWLALVARHQSREGA